MCTQVYDDNVMNTAEKNELSEYMEVRSSVLFLCSLIVEIVLGRLPR